MGACVRLGSLVHVGGPRVRLGSHAIAHDRLRTDSGGFGLFSAVRLALWWLGGLVQETACATRSRTIISQK